MSVTKLSKEARTKAIPSSRIARHGADVREATVSRNYLDVLLALPWARNRSSSTHYRASGSSTRTIWAGGRSRSGSSNIWRSSPTNRLRARSCARRPAGVAKTSLGRSIARATGREFVRQSLGRRPRRGRDSRPPPHYIGSLPGKIVTNLRGGHLQPALPARRDRQARPDSAAIRASALLEVLDPKSKQPVPGPLSGDRLRLSDVMFVTTADTMDMPQPLLDRMEIIRLEGYTRTEVQIATRHLIPKQIEAHGLKGDEMILTEEGLAHPDRH